MRFLLMLSGVASASAPVAFFRRRPTARIHDGRRPDVHGAFASARPLPSSSTRNRFRTTQAVTFGFIWTAIALYLYGTLRVRA